MGVRDRPISPGAPWQNGYAERLIGTLRRECLDQVVIFGEAHLRRILSSYASYYNLQSSAYALGITERCAPAPSSPTIWRHCRHSDLGWATSPIRPDMIFGKDNLVLEFVRVADVDKLRVAGIGDNACVLQGFENDSDVGFVDFQGEKVLAHQFFQREERLIRYGETALRQQPTTRLVRQQTMETRRQSK